MAQKDDLYLCEEHGIITSDERRWKAHLLIDHGGLEDIERGAKNEE